MQVPDNIRGWFSKELYRRMKLNKNIILVVGDLWNPVFEHIKNEMPDQFINPGAAEQAMVGIAVGLALEGKIPFVYSITPFVIYRPFETIRNYLHNEQINVKLIGNGRGRDYEHDGFSHWAEEDEQIMGALNIKMYRPDTKEEARDLVSKVLKSTKPAYINLKR